MAWIRKLIRYLPTKFKIICKTVDGNSPVPFSWPAFPIFLLSLSTLHCPSAVKKYFIFFYSQGPLINSKQFDRVVSMVNDAVDKGAELVTGGEKHPIGDLYFRPTILTELTPEMAAFKEEIFGPVISVLKFKTEDEALALANATRVGLAGYFFSNDVRQCWRVAKKMEVITVNLHSYQDWSIIALLNKFMATFLTSKS
jgi:hypothetical protein